MDNLRMEKNSPKISKCFICGEQATLSIYGDKLTAELIAHLQPEELVCSKCEYLL